MINTAGRLYRIMNFHQAVQMFENGELFFSHPSAWSDPYETRLVHGSNDRFFGQCWCTTGVSDAMWRIYSPTHLGVRIATSTRKLRLALEKASCIRSMTVRLAEVTYLSPHDLRAQTQKIYKDLKVSYDPHKAGDLLFLKRSAFQHESEYRALLTVDTPNPEREKKGLIVPIDPYALVDNILIDPRAPKELAEALIFYFKEKLRFKRSVRVSALYRSPTPLVLG